MRQAPEYSVNVNGAVKREDSGLDSLFGTNIYSFSANIDDFEIKAGTDYFLSIVADTTANPANTWAWAGDNNSFSFTGFGSRNGGAFRPVIANQSIFTLDDAKLATASVSEPGTLALMLGGVLALAARRRNA